MCGFSDIRRDEQGNFYCSICGKQMEADYNIKIRALIHKPRDGWPWDRPENRAAPTVSPALGETK